MAKEDYLKDASKRTKRAEEENRDVGFDWITMLIFFLIFGFGGTDRSTDLRLAKLETKTDMLEKIVLKSKGE